MNRLTNEVEAKQSQETIKMHLKMFGEAHPSLLRYVKLAAYEDTGLEPEEVNKYFDGYVKEINRLRAIIAEYDVLKHQERLIKLPCKVGDTVYALAYEDNKYYPRKVSAVKITSQGFVIEYRDKRTVRSRKLECNGAFLTQEDAEKALEEV